VRLATEEEIAYARICSDQMLKDIQDTARLGIKLVDVLRQALRDDRLKHLPHEGRLWSGCAACRAIALLREVVG